MAGRLRERGEELVRDRVGVDPERAQPHTMHRALAIARVTVREVRAHHELAALERNQGAQFLALQAGHRAMFPEIFRAASPVPGDQPIHMVAAMWGGPPASARHLAV